MKGQILALGGGGFSMEDGPLLDDFLLSLSPKPRPRICFVATASGDNENYIVRFYRRFSRAECTPTHLELFRRKDADLKVFAAAQDILFVGGGNTANMLAVWRLHGFDDAVRAAAATGTVLSGISAGAVCWYEEGVTDSFGPELAHMQGLGLLAGSHCPHYDGETARRPAYHRLLGKGMRPGIAADDGVALHYVDGSLQRVVSSRESAKAYRVCLENGAVSETVIDPDFLG